MTLVRKLSKSLENQRKVGHVRNLGLVLLLDVVVVATARLLVALPVFLLAVLVAVGHLGALAAQASSSGLVAMTASELIQFGLRRGLDLGLGPGFGLLRLGWPDTNHLVHHELGLEVLNRAEARKPDWRVFGPKFKTNHY